MNTKKPCMPPYYSSESEFRSGCSSQGIEKGGRDVFSFPSCTSNRTKIGTEGWTVSAGISIPPRQTCQGYPLSTTHFLRLLKHNQTPPTEAWLTVYRGHSAAAKLDVPHSRRCRGISEKRLWKQLLGDEKLMWYYHASSSSSSPSFVSGWSTEDTPVTIEHWSGTLLCVIWGDGILIWCAVYDGSNCLIKSGIFIRVHRHWVVGILMWPWLDVHSNRLVQKERLHGEQNKGRYEKKAGLWMTEEALFFCTNITETGLLRTSSGSCFLLCATGWATARERTFTSPAFILSTFSSTRTFLSRAGPWQTIVHPFNELKCLYRGRSNTLKLLWCNQHTFIKNNRN